MPLKVMTIVGTRPELIKLAPTLKLLDECFQHIFVHTGQNYDYELNEIFFRDLQLRKPDYFLESARESAAKTIGAVISSFDEVLEKENPDALLIYGDTNSCLGVISAKRRKVPIFHMEAGNRCFDQRVPEEINRKVVDHLSDINMVHSEHARRYLLAEGLRPETIIKTGSPLGEVFLKYRDEIESSQILSQLSLTKGQYFLVSAHREENVDYEENFKNLLNSLNFLAEKFNYPIIFSTHPRTQKRLDSLKDLRLDEQIKLMKPLGFFDYNKLQQNAFCVISDSGTITEESHYLNFPGITTRNAHERPEGMDVGKVIMSGLTPERIYDSVNLAVKLHGTQKRSIENYSDDTVSSQVVKIVQSYTGYVNRTVWSKGSQNV